MNQKLLGCPVSLLEYNFLGGCERLCELEEHDAESFLLNS